jgi:hypothetical protein
MGRPEGDLQGVRRARIELPKIQVPALRGLLKGVELAEILVESISLHPKLGVCQALRNLDDVEYGILIYYDERVDSPDSSGDCPGRGT